MIHKIVVGIDGSDAAAHAAKLAAEIAEKFEAELVLVFAVPPVALAPEVGGADLLVLDSNRRAGEELLDTTKKSLQRAGIRIEGALMIGSAAESICDRADAENADLVVVGSRGRGAVTRILLGSVATRLSHICGRPLLIVHPDGWRRS